MAVHIVANSFEVILMKWLKVYGLPRLPLFLARWAMKLGLPGPT